VSTSDRPLVLIGMKDAGRRRVADEATALGIATLVIDDCASLSSQLDDVEPLAIALQLDAAGAGHACAFLRSQSRFGQLAIFGVAPVVSDLSFTEAFVWGVDDVVTAGTPDAMSRRLRALLAPGAARGGQRSSEKLQSVVAGADATWRTVMGRSLYNGGFSVRFAVNADSLVKECFSDSVAVAVVADDLAPGGSIEALSEVRLRGSKTACVLVAPRKRMATATSALRSLGRAAVADGFAPPENVLFLVNELLAPRGVDKRASARLLYGTTVAFRCAGRVADEVGFSYNVSAGGLYIRTLAPLEPGQEAWLELWTPRSERRVRLAGTVAWRRSFGNVGTATVPAGFGVCLTDGLAGDLERWRAGYDAFATSLLGP
jgi:ActR/RegA family two-component response regulator